MKKILALLLLLQLNTFAASLYEAQSVAEFNDLLSTTTVPVVVQFSAYWCQPCQKLKPKIIASAAKYSDQSIRAVYVDAYVHSSLKKYLLGGYPTVRVFKNSQIMSESFVGDKTQSVVDSFFGSVAQ